MNPESFTSMTMRPTLYSPLLFVGWLASLMIGCGAHPAPDAGTPSRDVGDAKIDANANTGTDAGIALVDHELWEVTSAEADPFDDRPDTVACDPQAYGTEVLAPEETFYVKSQGCNYITVNQPLAETIDQDDTIQIHAWHFDLTAPAASEAHLALMIGGHLIWEKFVPIPSDSELLLGAWTAPESIPAGQDIYFHVHNHGNNEYNLVEVSLQR